MNNFKSDQSDQYIETQTDTTTPDQNGFSQSAEAVEYTDCTSAEG